MAPEKDAITRTCTDDPNFAIICSFFENFGDKLPFETPDFKQLQLWLEDTKSKDVRPELKLLQVKLMRKARRTVHEFAWEAALKKFCLTYSAEDAELIETIGYHKSSLEMKLRILRELVEIQFLYNNKFRAEIFPIRPDDLRCQPIGCDRFGNSYWIQEDSKSNFTVFKEHLDKEIWQVVATRREDVVQLIGELKESGMANLRKKSPPPDVKTENESDEEMETNEAGSEEDDDIKSESPEFSEVIEEEKFVVQGEGSGAECLAGNQGEKENVHVHENGDAKRRSKSMVKIDEYLEKSNRQSLEVRSKKTNPEEDINIVNGNAKRVSTYAEDREVAEVSAVSDEATVAEPSPQPKKRGRQKGQVGLKKSLQMQQTVDGMKEETISNGDTKEDAEASPEPKKRGRQMGRAGMERLLAAKQKAERIAEAQKQLQEKEALKKQKKEQKQSLKNAKDAKKQKKDELEQLKLEKKELKKQKQAQLQEKKAFVEGKKNNRKELATQKQARKEENEARKEAKKEMKAAKRKLTQQRKLEQQSGLTAEEREANAAKTKEEKAAKLRMKRDAKRKERKEQRDAKAALKEERRQEFAKRKLEREEAQKRFEALSDAEKAVELARLKELKNIKRREQSKALRKAWKEQNKEVIEKQKLERAKIREEKRKALLKELRKKNSVHNYGGTDSEDDGDELELSASSASDVAEEVEDDLDTLSVDGGDGEPLQVDHEFSCESDFEDDRQVVPLKLARTVQSEGDQLVPDRGLVESCTKCDTKDHPERILLCSTCDSGYHIGCLSPELHYIPEYEWICPVCQHDELVQSLEQWLIEFDDRIIQRAKDEKQMAMAERKQRRSQAQPKSESEYSESSSDDSEECEEEEDISDYESQLPSSRLKEMRRKKELLEAEKRKKKNKSKRSSTGRTLRQNKRYS